MAGLLRREVAAGYLGLNITLKHAGDEVLCLGAEGFDFCFLALKGTGNATNRAALQLVQWTQEVCQATLRTVQASAAEAPPEHVARRRGARSESQSEKPPAPKRAPSGMTYVNGAQLSAR